MDGIIIIDKPKNYTSRDIVNIIGKKLDIRKIGHTGTLDPLATGVLVLCIGKGLKLVELLTSETKEYITKMKLGIETDTLDITGHVIKERNMKVTKQDVIEAISKFKGKIIQEVPKYSAIKVNGKKLYEYARNNIEVKIPSREVNIYNIELLEFDDNEITLKCLVSKGTYIRSLVRDIGYKLNGYGTMTELRRTKQGNFNIDSSYTLKDIESNNYKIISISEVLKDMNKITVSGELLFKIKNGCVLDKFFDSEKALILDTDNKIIAIYYQCGDKVKPYRMFN